VAVTHRHPFDQPEAEQELADGFPSNMPGQWGMFFVVTHRHHHYILGVAGDPNLRRLAWAVWHSPQIPFIWFPESHQLHHDLPSLLRASIPAPRYFGRKVMAFGWSSACHDPDQPAGDRRGCAGDSPVRPMFKYIRDGAARHLHRLHPA
jgi:NADH-quinone oxidoreductase subunit H